MWLLKLWQSILPTSVSFQTILILTILVIGGDFEILVRHGIDFFNHSDGVHYLFVVQSMQWWTLPAEIIFMLGAIAGIIALINKANNNQRSKDNDRDYALIKALNKLPRKIAIEIKNQHINMELQNGNQENKEPSKNNQT